MKPIVLTLIIISFIGITRLFSQLPDGRYIIELTQNGKRLDADLPNIKNNGCKIQLWSGVGGAPQQVWMLKRISTNSTTPQSFDYKVTLAASGLALDADLYNLNNNGCKVQLVGAKQDGFKTQTWTITQISYDNYYVVLKADGKFLDADFPNIENNGCKVSLWSERDGAIGTRNQTWKFTYLDEGLQNGYHIEENTTERKYVLNNNLPTMNAENQSYWNQAMNNQQGVYGSDFHGHENLGSACFERAVDTKLSCFEQMPLSLKTALAALSKIPILGSIISDGMDNINFWYPQKRKDLNEPIPYYKRTLTGVVSGSVHLSDESCVYADYDLNVDIIPNQSFQYLIDAAAPSHHTDLDWFAGEHCPSRFSVVESEIDIRNHDGDDFKSDILGLLTTRQTQTLSVFGPWIYDHGHCDQPEIHPAEQIWWSDGNTNSRTYTCGLFCDASKRYWHKNQMDDGDKIRPWAMPPVKGIFAFAFEVPLPNNISANSQNTSISFDLQHIADYNVNYAQFDNNKSSSSKDVPATNNTNKKHSLVYNGQTLVSFTPNCSAWKVSFEKLGLVSGAAQQKSLRGFLVIQAEVGDYKLLRQIVNSVGVLRPNTSYVVQPFATPNTVPQEIEPQAYELVEGNYAFKVTQTIIDNHIVSHP